MIRAVTFTFALLTFLLTACASNPASKAASDCVVASADSSYIGAVPLYLECSVDKPAEVVTSPLDYRPEIPTARPRPGVTCYTAEVQFVVGADGRPERGTERLVRTNERALGEALLQSVAGWRYTPAMLDGNPVRQLVRERRGVALAVTVSTGRGGQPRRPALPPHCS